MGSWIESFVSRLEPIQAPESFRRWAAIATVAAALEQRVWMVSGGEQMYPNLYVMLVGHPGTGKSRTIKRARQCYVALKEHKIAPVSLTSASLVDNLVKAKRFIPRLPEPPLEFNSMLLCASEFGSFMSKYDNDTAVALSQFYDVEPYDQDRRKFTDGPKVVLRPQINMLAGIQPSMLMDVMPESAWGQGFTSRMLMVFSDERIMGDDFADVAELNFDDLKYDLSMIGSLTGQFHITEEFKRKVNNWRQMGEPPVPNHPRLIHYITRRRQQLYKLAMVSAIERSNALVLAEDDFNRAYNWLCNVEVDMGEVFKAGVRGADGATMDEIHHYITVNDRDHGVSEQKIVRFASERVPFHSVLRIIDIMVQSGRIRLLGTDKRTQVRWFTTKPEVRSGDLD